MINLAELAFLSWQKEEEIARQKAVVLCRQFFDGIQATKLTARQREFLNAADDHEFNLNVCRSVIDAMTDRLLIQGITSNEKGDASAGSVTGVKPLATWADALFEASGLNLLQHTVHEGALRDGEYFVIVDWDEENMRPRFMPHYRYTDATVDGDGFGCKAHYPDDDTNQPMQYASKRWIETLDTQGKTRSRMNLYFPDRVEKYAWAGSGWAEFRDENDTMWPIPRLDKTGKPLGIQVIQFPSTPDLRSETWDAIPIQRGINKALIDLLAAADATGFRILMTYGWIPTTDGNPPKADGSNRAKIQPGTILGTTKSKSEAGHDTVEGADLGSLIETLNSLIGWFAVVTSTPASRVSFTKMIASEGTLKQQNEGLFAKTRKRQMMFGRSWMRCFEMARKLANTFGNANLPEDAAFALQWEPIQARDTTEEQNEWKVKKEIGVPLETILSEMGYSTDEVAAMKATEEWQARMAMMNLGLNTNGDGSGTGAQASATDGG
jgi:hypothetical protein